MSEGPESEREPGVSWGCSVGCRRSWCSRGGRVGTWWEVTLGASGVGSLGNQMCTSEPAYKWFWGSEISPVGSSRKGDFIAKGTGCIHGTQRCSPALGRWNQSALDTSSASLTYPQLTPCITPAKLMSPGPLPPKRTISRPISLGSS